MYIEYQTEYKLILKMNLHILLDIHQALLKTF